MNKKWIRIALTALAFTIVTPAWSADQDTGGGEATGDDGGAAASTSIDRSAPPEELARETISTVLSALEGRRAELKRNPQELYALVDRLITPLIDIEYTAKLVLGRHWRDASPKQRERFTRAFKGMLMRTYADALLQFKDPNIEYLPLRREEGSDRATLRANVDMSNGETVTVGLSLRRIDDKWMVYDAAVGSLSLVPNYRVQFSNQIDRQGLDAVIKRMEEKYLDSKANQT